MDHPSLYTFKAESKLGELSGSCVAFDIETPGSEVGRFFEEHPEAPGIILTRDGVQEAALSQTTFLRKVSQPFQAFLASPAYQPMLVLPQDCTIPEAFTQCLARAEAEVHEPFLVEDEQTGVVGMVDFRALMLAASQLLQPQHRLLKTEISEGEWGNTELPRNRQQLEQLMAERTAQLEDKYALLEAEIAERKLKEMALSRSQQRHRLLIEKMLQGVLHLDASGKSTLLNPAAERIFGKTLLEFTGVDDSGEPPMLHEDGTPMSREEHPSIKALRTGREVRDVVVGVFNPKESGYRWISVSAVPLFRDGEKRPCEVYAVFDDITERRKAEAAHRQLEVQARHALKMESIGQLAAGIAHEINTPIQYVGDNIRFLGDAFADLQMTLGGYTRFFQSAKTKAWTEESIIEMENVLQMADMEYLSAEIPSAIQQSKDGVERVAKIVSAMKEFSHPGAKEKAAVDLNRSIESTLTVCRNEWKYVAEMVTQFDPELPLVTCLPGEINQMILNIVVNAAHAISDAVGTQTNTQGTITVSTRRDGNFVEIRISDTGTGIPEQAHAHIFDPFFTTKGVGRGTGQGLAIAHSVAVEKHGGSITFETESGLGTTFIIRLPIKPPLIPENN